MFIAHKRAGRALGVIAAATLGTVGFAALPAQATVEADGTITVDIAAITDFHGHIETASVVAQKLADMRTANVDTLFVSNGDNVGGSAYVSSIAKDVPTMQILNTMGLQVSALGNHEFDNGYQDIVNNLSKKDAADGRGANFPWLVANIEGVDPAVAPAYTVLTTASGVRVGFVGTVTDDLDTLVSPTGIAGLKVTDPVAATDKYAAQLKDGVEDNGEADVVVALMHADRTVGARVGDKVDAVIAGHTHVNEHTTTASGAPVIEPDCFGAMLGHVQLKVNKATKKVEATGENIKLDPKTAPKDAAIEAKFLEAKAAADELGKRTIGTIDGAPVRATNKGDDFGANRGSESSLSNLLAEGFRAYGQGMDKKPDLGIMNPGGVRADLDPNKDGTVTYGESYSVQPFGNSYATVDLTAAQIYTMLEQQWNKDDNAARPILRLGLSKNVSYIYDPAAAWGSRVTEVTINGKKIARDDVTTKFVVASNQFLLAGGDGFVVFKEEAVQASYKNTGLIDNDAFNKYLEANPGLKIDYTQRSIGVTGPTTAEAGKEITLKLSSLVMTGSEPKAVAVDVAFNGAKAASAPIDPTIVANRDEAGTATVTFMIPAETAAGTYDVAITAGESTANYTLDVAPALPATPTITVTPEGVKNKVTVTGWDKAWEANYRFVATIGDNTVAVPSAFSKDVLANGGTFYLEDALAPLGGAEQYYGKTVKVDSYYFDKEKRFLPKMYVDPASVVPGQVKDRFIKLGTDEEAVEKAVPVPTGNSWLVADTFFTFGRTGDLAFMGDWDGDGIDTPAVVRGNMVYVNDALMSGPATSDFAYGRVGDRYLVGDWDGDGKDTFAVQRGNSFFYKNTLEGGEADGMITYGKATDEFIAGDWDGDNKDTLVARRGNMFFAKNTLEGGEADYSYAFGKVTDRAFAAKSELNATAFDTISLVRGEKYYVALDERATGVAEGDVMAPAGFGVEAFAHIAVGARDTLVFRG